MTTMEEFEQFVSREQPKLFLRYRSSAELTREQFEETTTRFWVRSTEVDRELRVVHTPEIPPGEAIEVTALWDLRDGPGPYTITVTADAFSQIDEVRKDNNIAMVHVRVRGNRAELE